MELNTATGQCEGRGAATHKPGLLNNVTCEPTHLPGQRHREKGAAPRELCDTVCGPGQDQRAHTGHAPSLPPLALMLPRPSPPSSTHTHAATHSKRFWKELEETVASRPEQCKRLGLVQRLEGNLWAAWGGCQGRVRPEGQTREKQRALQQDKAAQGRENLLRCPGPGAWAAASSREGPAKEPLLYSGPCSGH